MSKIRQFSEKDYEMWTECNSYPEKYIVKITDDDQVVMFNKITGNPVHIFGLINREFTEKMLHMYQVDMGYAIGRVLATDLVK
jgi:hypothetical protein